MVCKGGVTSGVQTRRGHERRAVDMAANANPVSCVENVTPKTLYKQIYD